MRWEASEKRIGVIRLDLWFKRITWVAKLITDYSGGAYGIRETSPHSGEGNDTPLQYSCLENPMDGGAWWAAVYGVAQSWT